MQKGIDMGKNDHRPPPDGTPSLDDLAKIVAFVVMGVCGVLMALLIYAGFSAWIMIEWRN